MGAQLNHTIAWCSDKARSANFLSEILGLTEPRKFLHFLVVDLENDVSIDFFETTEPIALQHFAFLVSEDDFDAALGRIRSMGLDFWADPGRSRPSEVNHNDGGRGVYLMDPDGHLLELITRPYGYSGKE
ncbi:MAG TPA: VOC family protein [Pyrinomonadaceae bacterium]|nr:VOC family protein [Pyrinomonadaceae bacterium]